MAQRRLGACLVALLFAALAAGRPDVPLVPVPPPPLGAPDAPPEKAAARPTAAELHRAAREKAATFDSYIVRLSRREVVKGTKQPEEVMLFRFRAKPWSVYFKWLGKEGQGREVVYVKGQHEGKIHSLLAAGDVPFMPAGRRMALSPENVLVKNACRHPISEAGLAAGVERLGRLIADVERDPKTHGKLAVLGPLTRDEFEKPVYALEHTIPPGLDPTLERGGKRTYFFHPDSRLPTLIAAEDEDGKEAEYYRYDRLQQAVKLDDADFDPDALWGKPAVAASR